MIWGIPLFLETPMYYLGQIAIIPKPEVTLRIQTPPGSNWIFLVPIPSLQ